MYTANGEFRNLDVVISPDCTGATCVQLNTHATQRTNYPIFLIAVRNSLTRSTQSTSPPNLKTLSLPIAGY